MQQKKYTFSSYTLRLFRLAFIHAREGGVFKTKLILHFRLLFPKLLKTLHFKHSTHRGAIHYGEREFSFDETPRLHFKVCRPSSLRFKIPCIPCINPQVDFDYDFEFKDDGVGDAGVGKSFLTNGGEDVDDGCEVFKEIIECDVGDDEGIDLKADKFISKFYEQMKMQRQLSLIQYNEMLERGTG